LEWLARGHEETSITRAAALLKTRILFEYEELSELQGEDAPTKKLEKMTDERINMV
jgi:hypothetical protein